MFMHSLFWTFHTKIIHLDLYCLEYVARRSYLHRLLRSLCSWSAEESKNGIMISPLALCREKPMTKNSSFWFSFYIFLAQISIFWWAILNVLGRWSPFFQSISFLCKKVSFSTKAILFHVKIPHKNGIHTNSKCRLQGLFYHAEKGTW